MAHRPALRPAPNQPREPEPPAVEAVRPPASWEEMYGLSRNPFADAAGPDSAYTLFASQRRSFEMAADHLLNGRGVLVLTGEAGVGKSAMLQALMRLTRDREAAPAPAIMLQGADLTMGRIQSLLSPPEARQRLMLLLDDTDHLPPDVAAWLADRWSGTAPGQDPSPEARQPVPIAQGVDAAIVAAITIDPATSPLQRTEQPLVRLPRLTQAEMREFIEHRLWTAGGSIRRLLSPEALRLIILRAEGLPAAANRLMEAAFTAGFVRGDPVVTARTTEAAIGPRRLRRPRMPSDQASWIIPLASGLLFTIGAGVFLYRAVTQPAPVAEPQRPRDASQVVEASPRAEAAQPIAPEMMAALMRRGEQSMALGDIAAARLLYAHAAEAGNGAAATAAGKTYDPNYLSVTTGQAEKPDPARAAAWYRKAIALGDKQAAELLRRLEGR